MSDGVFYGPAIERQPGKGVRLRCNAKRSVFCVLGKRLIGHYRKAAIIIIYY
jgi:hypothetical protein